VIPVPPTEFSSFVDIIRQRACCTPETTVFTFSAGAGPRHSLNYEVLDRRARTIGAWLQGLGGERERVLLVYPSGLDFIAALCGCLYAGAIAVPVYPPHALQTVRTVPRLLSIIRDADPSIALVAPEFAGIFDALSETTGPGRRIRCVSLPEDRGHLAENWVPLEVRPSDLALLQYTSGSTADPKGVMITHGNLLHNSLEIKRHFKLSPDMSAVSWLPPFHDMGLMGCLFAPLYMGFPVHLMSPLAFLQRPVRWLQCISTSRAQASGGPNFAYDLCVRRIGPDEKKNLDLSCWKIAFNGAEPVRWQTLERFAAAFRECGFRIDAFQPCYGLAEATLIVSGGCAGTSPSVLPLSREALESNRVRFTDNSTVDRFTAVGCGQVGENVAIVFPETSTGCDKDQIGEIWVSGRSVADGYWNHPAETRRTFRAFRSDTGEGPFLRTGDLGFKHDGELFVTGRLKDLIIIAGRNHYPNDIETTVERSHSAVRPGSSAAFSVVIDEEERLVVAVEVERRAINNGTDHLEVIRAIRRAVSETHDVPISVVALLKPGSIPKTSSGKIQRRACQGAFLRGDLELLGGRLE